MNPVLVLPDGVSVRNFALHDAILSQESDGTSLVLAPSGASPLFDRGVRSETLIRGEGRFEELLRYTLFFGHMHRVRTRSMSRVLQQRPRGSLPRRAAMRSIRCISRALRAPRVAAVLERAHNRVVLRNHGCDRYRAMFESSRSDVLFCGHQRPPEVLAPVLVAKEMGVPTVGFIFSWDNLSSKGRIAARFDHYFVWSEHMANELVTYYPWVQRSAVHVTGTPQFDPYADVSLVEDGATFLESIGADPARPVICYSGGDRGTAPEDPEHLRILLEVVADLPSAPQVVLRPAPVDDVARYASVIECHPELLLSVPKWTGPTSLWADRMPTSDDVRVLANLTRHCDLNVNMASTMTLDFAINGKPVINIGFDVSDPPPLGAPVYDVYYQFEHYRPVVEFEAAWVVRSRDELGEAVSAYLANPDLHSEGRQRLVDLEVDVPPGQSTALIRRALEEIAAG